MKGLILALMIVSLLAGEAFGQASVVQPNALNYGPGRIDGSTTYRYIGQNVTACGLATQPGRIGFLTIGVSPYETVIVFPETDPQVVAGYSFKTICVSGPVTVSQLYMGLNRATIEVDSPSQVDVLSDAGFQQPPSQKRCGPCLNPNGTISGRACYGGGRRANEPIPPC